MRIVKTFVKLILTFIASYVSFYLVLGGYFNLSAWTKVLPMPSCLWFADLTDLYAKISPCASWFSFSLELAMVLSILIFSILIAFYLKLSSKLIK
jgi:hypothetical protein